MSDLRARIEVARSYMQTAKVPTIGIILGTGIGNFSQEITNSVYVPYSRIPGFPVSTTECHKGRFVFGEVGGKYIMAMEGRFHSYEGYSMEDVTLPVRIMKAMGCSILIVTNACGGLNSGCERGDIVVIDDHINLMSQNPLTGPNDNYLGDRFPDMYDAYDSKLRNLMDDVATEEGIIVHHGVYAAVQGPNLETPAEYHYLKTIGADLVGMSTVPEIIVGVHSKMRCLGLSVVSDLCSPDKVAPVSLPEIIEAAKKAEPTLTKLIKKFIERV
jgi:purine-nucleoside phosphorylase